MSNSTNQTESQPEICAPFKLECFDLGSSSQESDTDISVFEALFESEEAEHAFHHMSSDGVEEAEKTIRKAERIMIEAKEKVASIERDAYEKGFAQGEKDGLEMGTKKLDKVLEPIHKVLEEMVHHKHEFLTRYEKEILALICRIAGKVVCGKVKIEQGVVKETIFDSFKLAADRSEVTLKLSPEDIEYVKDLRPEFFDRISDLKSISMESDTSISPGGCIMETAFGHIDARVESQLEKITEAVEQAFEEKHAGISDSQTVS